MGFIFGSIARLHIDRYFEFLLIGILVWTWWASGVTAATTSIVERPELVRRPGLPRMVVPLVAIATAFIDFLFAVPLLLVVLVVTGGIGWPALLVPTLLLTEGIWIVGVGLIACASNVYFRDTKPIVETAMLIGFYVTPVVYTARAGARLGAGRARRQPTRRSDHELPRGALLTDGSPACGRSPGRSSPEFRYSSPGSLSSADRPHTSWTSCERLERSAPSA